VEIVGEHGLEALTMATLSERGQCSPAAAARHYATVELCLYEAFDELLFSGFVEVAGAFAEPAGWEAAFAAAFGRLLRRLAANPAQARLCFMEVPRASRALRRRRALTRQWLVDLLVAEQAKRSEDAELTALQLEMLTGAGMQAIASMIAAGRCRELPDLEPELLNLLRVFTPVAA
jgi:hypothetical protein